MHLRVFGADRNEDVPQHLLDLLVDARPASLVIFLELFNEVLVFYLLEA